MKKKLPAFLLCLCLMIPLAACDQPAPSGAGSLPPKGSPETGAPAESDVPETAAPTGAETPAPEESQPVVYPEPGTVPLSDILDEEQIALFEQAEELFLLLFGGDTEKIDFLPGWEEFPATDPEKWEYNGWTYSAVRGYYADWETFIAGIRAVSTDRWWAERNERDPGNPGYIEHDGRTYHLHASMGGNDHNDNFPDLYRLDGRTEDVISFTIIGHYSDFYPQEGETEEERDRRVATTYDYTLEFPIRLVLTEEGWRFDEYYVPIDATDAHWMKYYDTPGKTA